MKNWELRPDRGYKPVAACSRAPKGPCRKVQRVLALLALTTVPLDTISSSHGFAGVAKIQENGSVEAFRRNPKG